MMNGWNEISGVARYTTFSKISYQEFPFFLTGPLHDPVTWYKITHAGEQVAQWDFQNKGRTKWTGTSCATCSPACVILYHVTGSCKGRIVLQEFSAE